jgi:hypothetical protein
MAWITNTRQSQTSFEENGTNMDLWIYQRYVGACEPDRGLQLELNLWNISMVQADHSIYTIVTDRSCDVTVTLDVGLVPCSEDTLFESIFCWCQVWSRFVCCRGQKLSKLVQQKTVSCFYSIQAEDKRAYRREIYIIFLYAKCCERLIVIFYQVLHFRVGDTLSYSI